MDATKNITVLTGAARSAQEHAHAMQGIFKRIGRVRSTQEILAAL
jgi:isochorismate hydrolase